MAANGASANCLEWLLCVYRVVDLRLSQSDVLVRDLSGSMRIGEKSSQLLCG